MLADGKLVSIPASEIDTAKTAAARRGRRPRPPKAPGSDARRRDGPDARRRPPAPRATAKKAAVVLTDQDVAGGYLEPRGGEEGGR